MRDFALRTMTVRSTDCEYKALAPAFAALSIRLANPWLSRQSLAHPVQSSGHRHRAREISWLRRCGPLHISPERCGLRLISRKPRCLGSLLAYSWWAASAHWTRPLPTQTLATFTEGRS